MWQEVAKCWTDVDCYALVQKCPDLESNWCSCWTDEPVHFSLVSLEMNHQNKSCYFLTLSCLCCFHSFISGAVHHLFLLVPHFLCLSLHSGVSNDKVAVTTAKSGTLSHPLISSSGLSFTFFYSTITPEPSSVGSSVPAWLDWFLSPCWCSPQTLREPPGRTRSGEGIFWTFKRLFLSFTFFSLLWRVSHFSASAKL